MWFIQPKQDYIPEIPWKHVDEPAVMAWQIRARNYNTTPDNLTVLLKHWLGNIHGSRKRLPLLLS